MQVTIYTIGHSNLTYEEFIKLLKKYAINVIIDVRSQPFSRRFPQFNKHELDNLLEKSGICYSYRGDKLGGRPKNPSFYEKQRVSYERLGRDKEFNEAIDDLIKLASSKIIALMCSEKDPMDCHRALLIGRILKNKNVLVQHILANGKVESQDDLEKRMLGEESGQMLLVAPGNREEMLDEAYRRQAEKVAFKTD